MFSRGLFLLLNQILNKTKSHWQSIYSNYKQTINRSQYIKTLEVWFIEVVFNKVIIHNDDFTTMEFVVNVLTTVFYKSHPEAETLMLAVHKAGSAVVGIYSYDIAKSKINKATTMARNEGYPLRLTLAPEE